MLEAYGPLVKLSHGIDTQNSSRWVLLFNLHVEGPSFVILSWRLIFLSAAILVFVSLHLNIFFLVVFSILESESKCSIKVLFHIKVVLELQV